MKVLLIQSPSAYGIEMPSLGLAYLTAYLRDHDHTVSMLDLNVDLYKRAGKEEKRYWDTNMGYCWFLEDEYRKLKFITDRLYAEYTEKILSFQSDVLGFSIQNTSLFFTLGIIRRIKEVSPQTRIILGGPSCYNVTSDNSDFRMHFDLQEFADAVVVGEGEETLRELLRRMESGESMRNCRGIALPLKKARPFLFWTKRWVFNGLPEPIKDLDRLPFPALDAYDLKAYTDPNALPLAASRGCTMNCVFCTDTAFWRPYRYRSAENVACEILEVHRKYKNGFFHFNDSIMNGTQKNVLVLCDLLVSMGLGIKWGGNFRVDARMDMDSIRRMKEAGCEYLILGIESASNKILKDMRKGFTIEEAEDFINKCHQAGIAIEVNWIAGFPGETEEDFQATLDFILSHRAVVRKNTFSSLTINQFSYLEKHKEEFGIQLDSQHLGMWSSNDGKNNFELRNSRLWQLEEIERQRGAEYDIVRQKI